MKVVIADDEAPALERLRGLLLDHTDVQILAEASDGTTALEACQTHIPDIVLLDIAMPGMTGLDVAHALSTLPVPPAVIFCTAYDAHALSAFDAAALDYLMKPIRAERLAGALERARVFLAGRNQGEVTGRQHLCAKLRGSLRMIPIEEIHYLQAEEKYVVVHHSRGQDLVEDSLKALEEEFSGRFIRIHRSCLVTKDRLLELRRHRHGVKAIVRDVELPLEVSRRCVSALRQVLATR